MSINKTIDVVVRHRHEEAENIIRLELALPNGENLPHFTAGAHIDVHIPGTDLIRQYSIVNAPCESSHYVIAVQKEANSRGGSIAIHDHVFVDSHLTISMPRNHFKLVDSAPSAVLIAGGIGVTPILSMAQQLQVESKQFALHYVTKTQRRMAFNELLDQSGFSENVYRYHSGSATSPVFSIRSILMTSQPDTHIYVCGPALLIDAVLEEAESLAIPNDRVHREYFSIDSSLTEGENHAFEIKIASTGQCFTVPEDKSIAEILEEKDVFVPVSCEEGVCGTCLTGVIEGRVEHRDVYLTESEKKENKQMTVCCSRAQGNSLTLDL